jgi:sialate O-acetylesterase
MTPRRYLVGLVLLLFATTALADVKLPALFSDHTVLQQGKPVPVWGGAEPGEEVTVSFAGQTQRATADAEGKWKVKLNPLSASTESREMTVQGKNTLTVKDVLVGEVWVGSGQSNMQMTVGGVMNVEQEIAAADYPTLRMITVPNTIAIEPQTDFKGAWVVCSPETVGRFSAVGYFFARELWETVQVPVGIIHSSWGGTRIEPWMDEATFKGDPALKPILDARETAMENYAKALYDTLGGWFSQAAEAKAAGRPLPLPPVVSAQDPRRSSQMASGLYNAMIAPLVPYAIQGAIWYQGESNAGDPAGYRRLFPAMIAGWRQAWGQGDFPFLFVQLASFMGTGAEPRDTNWARLREAQTMTLATPNTGMAVIIDIGMPANIHPVNKQDVGKRLALWAEHMVYGKDVVYSGPLYDSMKVEEGAIRISFKHAEGGLVAKDGVLKGFAIAGEDGKFVWAEATIEGQTVVVKNAQVPQPKAVRYAWDDYPVCNLYNAAGLPASPFRTDMPE